MHLNVVTFDVYTFIMLEKEINSRFTDEYHKLLVNLMYTGSWIYRQNNQFLKQWELSPEQFNLLRILRGLKGEPATVAYLNERMLDQMSNVSRLVEKLRKKGLVARKTCKSDRRQVDIFITEPGNLLLQEIDQQLPELTDMLRHLSQEESRQLNSLLDLCRNKEN